MDDAFSRCFERRELLADEESYRLQLAHRYAYVLPEQHALEVVRAYSPLVELGAGTGYWAYLLRLMGADVIAYDHAPLGGSRPNRYHPDARPWTEVFYGDADVLEDHADRSLFVCWPPRYSAIWDCLRFYKGDVVVYVGDRGTRTADLASLEDCFALAEAYSVLAMDPAPDALSELTVWKRRDGVTPVTNLTP
jgi:hypothetical protein